MNGNQPGIVIADSVANCPADRPGSSCQSSSESRSSLARRVSTRKLARSMSWLSAGLVSAALIGCSGGEPPETTVIPTPTTIDPELAQDLATLDPVRKSTAPTTPAQGTTPAAGDSARAGSNSGSSDATATGSAAIGSPQPGTSESVKAASASRDNSTDTPGPVATATGKNGSATASKLPPTETASGKPAATGKPESTGSKPEGSAPATVAAGRAANDREKVLAAYGERAGNPRERMLAQAKSTLGADGRPKAVVNADPLPGGPRVLIPEKTFRAEGREQALRINYDDLDLLKVINMEPVTPAAGELLPEWLKGLNGKVVRIRGFMYPPTSAEGLERFLLARDNQICCFGRNPKVYDIIAVTMAAETTTDYIEQRPFDVVGRLRIVPENLATTDDLTIGGLYYLDDAKVITR